MEPAVGENSGFSSLNAESAVCSLLDSWFCGDEGPNRVPSWWRSGFCLLHINPCCWCCSCPLSLRYTKRVAQLLPVRRCHSQSRPSGAAHIEINTAEAAPPTDLLRSFLLRLLTNPHLSPATDFARSVLVILCCFDCSWRISQFAILHRESQSRSLKVRSKGNQILPSFTKTRTMPSLESPPKEDPRLLLVSNRLPITIKRSDDGKYDSSMSSGGLVSGLSGLSKTTQFQWYGWPGLEVPEDEIDVVTKRLKDEYNAVPVFIADDLAERHYNGFSSMFP